MKNGVEVKSVKIKPESRVKISNIVHVGLI